MGKVSFVETPEKYDYDIEDVEDGNPGSVFPYQDTPENKSWAGTLPLKQGLYDPELEKDACGVGFAAYVSQNWEFEESRTDGSSHIKGVASHKIISDGEDLC
jgi:glutamate synthase (NADPH/NADH)